MKRTEIAMIVLIASASMLITFFAIRTLVGNKVTRTATVEQSKVITNDIDTIKPTKRTFNQDAINPTVEVFVENSNPNSQASSSTTTPTTSTSSTTPSTSSNTTTTNN